MKPSIEYNINRIKEFGELEHGWNGENAPNIPKKVIDKAIKIVNNVKIQPEIFPTYNESLRLQYCNGLNLLEIEVTKDKILCYADDINYKTIINNKEIDIKEIDELYELVFTRR